MFRLGRKSFQRLQSHHQSLRKDERKLSSQPPSGASRLFIITAGTTVGVCGGVVGYCKYDPNFRETFEAKIPVLKPTLAFLLGSNVISEPEQPSKIRQPTKKIPDPLEAPMGNSRKSVKGNTPEKVVIPPVPAPELPEIKEIVATETPSVEEKSEEENKVVPSMQMSEDIDHKEATESAQELPQVTATNNEQPPPVVVDVREESPLVEPMMQRETTLDDELEVSANEAILGEMLSSCSVACADAILANNIAESAIARHSALLRVAVDSNQGSSLERSLRWESVKQAEDEMNVKKGEAKGASDRAREELAKMKLMIERSPDAADVGGSWEGMVEDVEGAVVKVTKREEEESMLEEYRVLVEDARVKLDGRLTGLPIVGGDIDILLHNQHRVEQLQRELVELREGHEVAMKEVVEKVREEWGGRRREEWEEEERRRREEVRGEWEEKLRVKEETLKEEMMSQLKRQASAHAEHLAQAMSYLERQASERYEKMFNDKLLEITTELQREVQEVRDEHEARTTTIVDDFQSKLNLAQAKVAGIESIVDGRATIEGESRKAQELSLACDGLLFSLKYGEGGLPTPLHKDLVSVKKVYTEHPAIEILTSSVPHEAVERGVYTEEMLRSAFSRIGKICRRVSMIDENKDSLLVYFLSYLKSLLTISSAQLQPPTEIDETKLDVFSIISYANYCVQHGDLEQAARFVNQLTGEPRKVVDGWLSEVRLFLETRQTIEALSLVSNSIVIGTQLE
ncbi:MICOS complex subunit MIC60-like [Ciona intestinalis]